MKVHIHSTYDNDLTLDILDLEVIPRKEEFIKFGGKTYVVLYVTHEIDPLERGNGFVQDVHLRMAPR